MKILNANKKLNDGEWHNVTLEQRGRTAILEVDKLQSPKIVQTDYQDLYLDGNIFIGGMKSSDYKIHRPESRNFSGCIEDLTFRGANLIRNAEIKSPEVSVYGNVAFKCEELDYRVVTLPNPNTGYRVTVRKLHADNDTFSTSFYFRTYIKQGLLLSRSAIKVKLNLRLSHGTLIYNLMAPNGSRTTLKLGSELDNGEWHKVNASVRGREVRLQLDEKIRTEPLNQSRPLMLDFANKSRLKIFLGAFEERDFPGFVGCVYNLQIDSHRITVNNLKTKSGKHTNRYLRNTCRLQNRCQPNPCKNRGICTQTWDRFYCNCKYTVFEGERCDISIYKATCEYYKAMGLKKSAFCLLDSVGGGTPYTAYCNLTRDAAKTTIRHDKMTKTRVGDGDMKGSDYLHEISYSIGMKQIEQLIRKSGKCRQHIRFHCFQSKLLNSPNGPPHALWLSRDSESQNYWGGAEPRSKKCACGMPDPPTCAGTGKFCNCDNKDRIWQVDEGYLTDKNTLPVTALKFNSKSERSDFTVGPLECWEGLDKQKISMIQPEPSGMATDNPLVKGCPNDPKPAEPTITTTSLSSTNKVSTPKICPTDNGNFYNACTTSQTSTPNVTMATPYLKTPAKEIQTSQRPKEFPVDNGTGELSTIAIVMISGALVVIVLLSMKLGLPRVIMCVRTHSKRGEYIVPPTGSGGYPARLFPLVAKRASVRGKQLTQYSVNDKHVEGNTTSGINSYWV